jgi:hypothetical protein
MSSLTHLLPPSSQPGTGTLQSYRLLQPTTNPIPLLSSPTAKYYSVAHTALIPLYYYFRAAALVRTPFDTLLWDLAVVATLQCIFCAVCLPRAGSWVSGTTGGAILEGTASSVASPTGGKGKSGKTGASGTGSMRRKGAPKGVAVGGMAGGGNIRARIMVSSKDGE